jgi:cold shock CspA family protein
MTHAAVLSKPTTAAGRSIEHDVAFGLTWQNDQLGSLTLQVLHFGHTWDRADDTANTWAMIPVTGRPDHLEVVMKYQLASGVELVHISEQAPCKITGKKVPSLRVPITWNGAVPSIRSKHKDNVDLVMYNEFGGFVMIEVGLTTRKGKFFLTLQEVYAGQVAHTNVAGAKEVGLTYHPIHENLVAVVLPLWEHSAYPGADFLRTWSKEGAWLAEMLAAENKMSALTYTEAAEWNPSAYTASKDPERLRGICTFFNIAATYGFILVPANEGRVAQTYFVHFSDIQAEFALQPMQVYEFFPVQEGNKWKAKQVRRVR